MAEFPSAETNYKAIEKLQHEPANKKCADCTSSSADGYLCLDFGTFVCFYCAEVHRSIGHTVKKIATNNIRDEDADVMLKNGNKVSSDKWLVRYTGDHPEPNNIKDRNYRVEYLRLKYTEKKWARSDAAPFAVTVDDNPRGVDRFRSASSPPVISGFGPAAVVGSPQPQVFLQQQQLQQQLLANQQHLVQQQIQQQFMQQQIAAQQFQLQAQAQAVFQAQAVLQTQTFAPSAGFAPVSPDIAAAPTTPTSAFAPVPFAPNGASAFAPPPSAAVAISPRAPSPSMLQMTPLHSIALSPRPTNSSPGLPFASQGSGSFLSQSPATNSPYLSSPAFPPPSPTSSAAPPNPFGGPAAHAPASGSAAAPPLSLSGVASAQAGGSAGAIASPRTIVSDLKAEALPASTRARSNSKVNLCPLCGASVDSRELGKHKIKECPFRHQS